ncbi:MAG TPA: hypothetical protein VGO52_05905 [Hyphomonadaceae bacterium]|nr:hypothetical protein [Hyphomonadaceae bacterium]
MRQRRGLGLALLAALAVAASAGIADAQSLHQFGYKAPRTSWGVPDLEGVWSNASVTDMQREPRFPNLVLTPAEAAEMERHDYYNVSTRAEQKPSDTKDTRLLDGKDLLAGGGYNSFWIDQGSKVARVKGTLRSSWIVEPDDGLIPYKDPARRHSGPGQGGSSSIDLRSSEYTAQTSKRDASKLSIGGPVPVNPAHGGQEGSYDNPETRPASERCLIGFGSAGGPVMGNVIYNNRYQIVQSPTRVMILVEMVHDARIVPVFTTAEEARKNFRPNVIKPWLGDSVGWYEGDELVVETRNANPIQRGMLSAQGKLTERFSRWNKDQVTYAFEVDDPALYSRKWKGEMALNATQRWFEYACHEGNYAMVGILAGARKLEREGRSVVPNFAEEGG